MTGKLALVGAVGAAGILATQLPDVPTGEEISGYLVYVLALLAMVLFKVMDRWLPSRVESKNAAGIEAVLREIKDETRESNSKTQALQRETNRHLELISKVDPETNKPRAWCSFEDQEKTG